MTPKQKLFVQHYLTNGNNKSKAAGSAGYSPKNLKEKGYQLYKNPSIRAAIDAAQKKTSKKLQITRESQLKALEDIKNDIFSEAKDKIAAIKEQNKMLGFTTPKAKDPAIVNAYTQINISALSKDELDELDTKLDQILGAIPEGQGTKES